MTNRNNNTQAHPSSPTGGVVGSGEPSRVPAVGAAEAQTRGPRLTLRRVDFTDAAAFVSKHHRHHTPPTGHIFSLGAYEADRLCGVSIVGRPVSRHRDDGMTAEITRLCTDGTKNAASFLLGRSARAAFALGFAKIGTYTLARETGDTLRAAGWTLIGEVKGRSWDTPSRRRTDKHPTENKLLWECVSPRRDAA